MKSAENFLLWYAEHKVSCLTTMMDHQTQWSHSVQKKFFFDQPISMVYIIQPLSVMETAHVFDNIFLLSLNIFTSNKSIINIITLPRGCKMRSQCYTESSVMVVSHQIQSSHTLVSHQTPSYVMVVSHQIQSSVMIVSHQTQSSVVVVYCLDIEDQIG